MKVSLNWIREFLDFELPDLATVEAKIGAQLGAIEETEDISERYQGIVVAKVVSCVDHPNSDHLHICMIDDGGAAKDVARDESGRVQVVCGAPNAREGILVAWLPPGTTVPETYGKDPFVLEARPLRGEVSNGMLASARELALGTDHEGIVELDPHDAKPGDDFAKTYHLDDQIIDIENKMFTHRPDCFGELGVAREISGILGHKFVSPDWYLKPLENTVEKSGDPLPLTIQNELPGLVPRFMAVAMHVGYLGQSPLWMQTYLSRIGLRPINNVVDITNYMMMLTGQPLHAYDYDKVKALSGDNGATIVVRNPHAGEKITLLNGKTIEPRAEAIMIATDKQLIGVGGVMGGADTEVDENTKNIILECATFDMYSIRRTSMAHGLFTDAVSRFNKGQSPLQNDRIVGESLRLLGQLAQATQASDIIDNNHTEGRAWVHPPVVVSVPFINERLGLKLSANEMKQLLENVEFKVEIAEASSPRRRGSSEKSVAEGDASMGWIPDQVGNDGDVLTVTAPFWRTDIELREDVVEEVGRLYGFDKLPLELPLRTIEPARKDELLELKSLVRGKLAASGANEILTYSFVHGNLLDKAGQDKNQAFQVSNAISPDLQYYRLSLTPSLLDKVHANIKAGYDEFALFEMGYVHHKQAMDEHDQGVPLEDLHVSFVFAATEKTAAARYTGAAYYEALKYAQQLLPDVTTSLVPLRDFDFADDAWGRQMCAPYEPNRSAVIVWNDLAWGVIGEYKPAVAKALKLPAYAAGFEFGLELMRGKRNNTYTSLPRFPKVEQDICLKVTGDTTYRVVYDFATETVNANKPQQTRVELSPVDIYQREDDKSHKQITLRLSIASYERTLTDEEVAKLLNEVAAAAKETLNAERV